MREKFWTSHFYMRRRYYGVARLRVYQINFDSKSLKVEVGASRSHAPQTRRHFKVGTYLG